MVPGSPGSFFCPAAHGITFSCIFFCVLFGSFAKRYYLCGVLLLFDIMKLLNHNLGWVFSDAHFETRRELLTFLNQCPTEQAVRFAGMVVFNPMGLPAGRIRIVVQFDLFDGPTHRAVIRRFRKGVAYGS